MYLLQGDGGEGRREGCPKMSLLDRLSQQQRPYRSGQASGVSSAVHLNSAFWHYYCFFPGFSSVFPGCNIVFSLCRFVDFSFSCFSPFPPFPPWFLFRTSSFPVFLDFFFPGFPISCLSPYFSCFPFFSISLLTMSFPKVSSYFVFIR